MNLFGFMIGFSNSNNNYHIWLVAYGNGFGVVPNFSNQNIEIIAIEKLNGLKQAKVVRSLSRFVISCWFVRIKCDLSCICDFVL